MLMNILQPMIIKILGTVSKAFVRSRFHLCKRASVENRLKSGVKQTLRKPGDVSLVCVS